MKIIPLLFILIMLVSISGFASASWLSHEWKELKKNVKLDWHFVYEYDHQKQNKTFDSARCGTYYWNVQDRKHCYGEWKEKGVYIRGW